MTVRPRIAVTACAVHRQQDYLEAVRAGGGEAVLVDHSGGIAALASCAGILITGGDDIDPARYGETPHPAAGAPDRPRDAFELDVARHASTHGVPLLAICRGLQVVNVSRGGTLVQDIPSLRPQAGVHHEAPTLDALAHPILAAPGSRIAALLAADTDGPDVHVNSRHHQAIGRLGMDLVVTANAPDGIVEAIEDPAHPFLLAVQFHPENFWKSGRFRALFAALSQAAARQR